MRILLLMSGIYSDRGVRHVVQVADDFDFEAKKREFARLLELDTNGRFSESIDDCDEGKAVRAHVLAKTGLTLDEKKFSWFITPTEVFPTWLEAQEGVTPVAFECADMGAYDFEFQPEPKA